MSRVSGLSPIKTPRVLNLPLNFPKPLPKALPSRLKGRGVGSTSLPSLTPQVSPANKMFRNFPLDGINRSCAEPEEDFSIDSDAKLFDNLEDEEKKVAHDLDAEEYEMALCGPQGLQKFHELYRKNRRIEEVRLHHHKKPPAAHAYLSKMSELRVTPKALGLVKPQGSKTEINMRNYAMGDKYASAFSAAINRLTQIESVDLGNNRLSNKGAIGILENTPIQLKRIDLSNNNISFPTYKTISGLLLQSGRNLKELVLDNNHAGDTGVIALSQALDSNNSLSYLSLSKNEITDVGAKALADMLVYNIGLSVLFLHWNNIKGKGATYLAEALMDNDKLLVFDSSFNSFGTSENNESAQAWARLFAINKTLVHLDLSHNGFKANDCKILADGLKENHSILGLHMMGNEGSIDVLGYLNPDTNQNLALSHVFTRIDPTLETGKRTSTQLISLKAYSNCWICEGWTQMKFVFISGVTIPREVGEDENVFLHLSFEDYVPDYMAPEGKGTYSSMRMVPPGPLNYFYSIGDKAYQGEGTKVIAHTEPITTKVELDNGEIKPITVPKTNIIGNIVQTRQLITKTYLTSMQCIPRAPPKIVPRKKRVKTPWTIPRSIFATYKVDDEGLLTRCFENDWMRCKIPKVIKDESELAKAKKALRKAYKIIREVYKYYSAFEPTNGVPCIGSNVYTDIMNQCNVVDSVYIMLSDIDIEMVASNAGKNKQANPRNPERSLVRYQMIEMIVRLAIRKYQKSGICQTQSEAVEKFLHDNILKTFSGMDSHKWRIEKYWNEECDIVLKKYLPIIKELYKKYSGKYTLPGRPKYVSMDEFIQMVNDAGVIDESFGSREIGVLYNLSMYTQVDEIDEDRHTRMFMDEFLDAIGRVADRLAVASPYDPESAKMDKAELAQLPTHLKLKNFIEILLKKTLRKDFVEFAEKKVLGVSLPPAKLDPELAFKVYRNPADRTQYSNFNK